MKRLPLVLSPISALLLSSAGAAQAPAAEVDMHVAAARAAAGQDYRNTFINLCLANAAPGGGRGAAPGGAGAAGAPAGGRGGAAPAGGRGGAPGGGTAPAGGRGGAAGGAGGGGASPDRSGWYAPPFKIFDNFYWLGSRQFSSWALQTSDGIIIFDTNFAYTTQAEIIDGLTTLGLNPRDIKYVIISHAHGDRGIL